MVYDDLTLEERTALGISEQDWMVNKIQKINSSPAIVPDDYTIVPKKFRIKF